MVVECRGLSWGWVDHQVFFSSPSTSLLLFTHIYCKLVCQPPVWTFWPANVDKWADSGLSYQLFCAAAIILADNVDAALCVVKLASVNRVDLAFACRDTLHALDAAALLVDEIPYMHKNVQIDDENDAEKKKMK